MQQIEVYGDSILKGVMNVGGKYRIFHGTLEERLADEQITLTRHCRMGSTVSDALVRMEKDFDAQSPAGKTVLLEFGGNDSDFDWKDVAQNPEGSFLPHTPPAAFENTYERAVRLVRARGGSPVVSAIIPIDADKYLDFLGRYYSKENILRWLGDASALYRWQENYARSVERIAARLCVPVIDIRDAFLRSRKYASLFSDDGIHPTEEGHRLIEDTVVGYFTEDRLSLAGE